MFTLRLQNEPIHSQIMRDVQKFLSNGYDEQAFVKMALNKNRFLIEESWNEEVIDSGEENSDTEEEDVISEEDKDSQESDDEESS